MNDRFHNIAWPAAIVALLLSSVALMTIVLIAARSDGGAQVVDDYYNRAVAWDSLSAVRTTSAERGWKVDLDITEDGSTLLVVADSTGAPVEGLAGDVSVRRPQFADALGKYPVRAVQGRPGAYAFDVEATGSGIWIFDIRLERGDLVHVAELRRRAEIR